MLNLATRAKLHLGQLIWGSWSFYWIPLSEKCRVDLKIIPFLHVQMELWIYFDYEQIVKVGKQTHVGSKAQQSPLFILNVAYRYMVPPPHLDTSFTHTSLLIGYGFLRPLSLHTCEEGTVLLLSMRWTTMTIFDCSFVWGISVWVDHISRHEIQVCLTNIDCTRACCWVDICWLDFFGLFLGWFDMLLEAELTKFDRVVLEVKISLVDQCWLSGYDFLFMLFDWSDFIVIRQVNIVYCTLSLCWTFEEL